MRVRHISPAAALALCLVAALAAGGAAAAPAAADLAPLLARAAAIQPWLVQTRRLLHTMPELFYEEHNTSATIRRYLDDLRIPHKSVGRRGCALNKICRLDGQAAVRLCVFESWRQTGPNPRCHAVACPHPCRFPVARTGVVATIGSGQGPFVALRADIDGLPIREEASVAYASRNEGRMHGAPRGGACRCGHRSAGGPLPAGPAPYQPLRRCLPPTQPAGTTLI